MIPRRVPAARALTGLRSTRLASTSRTTSAKTAHSTAATPKADPKAQTFRRVILTGAVALITAVGAVTGASLKTDRDAVKQQDVVRELPIDDRIAMLEERRAGFLKEKIPLERKLTDLRGRMAAKKEADEQKGAR